MPFYSQTAIHQSYTWICQKRTHHSPNSDIWHLRNNWADIRKQIIHQLSTQTYQLSPVIYYHIKGELIGVWSSKDAIVLKMLASYLSNSLSQVLSPEVYHLSSTASRKRGIPAAIDRLKKKLPNYAFIMRSDVKGYYASIDHQIILQQCRKYIDNPLILNLIKQYLQYTIYDEGIYRTNQQGLSLGCPLSPIMGALYLLPLDLAMAKRDVFYIRYMDDWIILATSRWKLRRAVKQCNQILNQLKVLKHPDKTYIGKVTKGFDFLGVQIDVVVENLFCTKTKGIMAKSNQDPITIKAKKVLTSPSKPSIIKYFQKISRLYEQGASKERIQAYRKRWVSYKLQLCNSLILGHATFYRLCPVGN